MSLHAKLPDVFSEDVTSLDDYKNRIQEIEKYCKSNGDDNWGTFYRGDLYDAKAQCNLFRSNSTTNEAELFNTWKNTHSKICEDFPEEFMQLAYMQHYCKKEDALYTRLLDFSTDSLVALRFACGEGENRRKKVTVYQTDYLRLNAIDRKEILESYMRLVKSQELLPLYKESQDEACWGRDTFVEVERNFPRIDRQKGLFLIMGNFTTAELLGEQDPDGASQAMKVTHELSENIGRGENCPGYVGVLAIAADCVEKIRRGLELMPDYRIDYLMDEETGANHA